MPANTVRQTRTVFEAINLKYRQIGSSVVAAASNSLSCRKNCEGIKLENRRSIGFPCSALVPSQAMRKGSFRDNIEKIVRLLPRPMMNGKLIAKSRNFWVIVEQYGNEDGIVVLNKFTDHGGQIPYDSIRKWQEPDMVILSAQVNVGKEGLFELSQFHDGPETEMLVEAEAFVPERLEFVKNKLKSLSQQETEVLRRLVIQGLTSSNAILKWYSDLGIAKDIFIVDGLFKQLTHETQLIEIHNHRPITFDARIKQEFVPILEQLLLSLPSKKSSTDR